MRCKNCGTENDDNRYICENCGSPLYDEEELEINEPDTDRTQSFRAVNSEPYGSYNSNNNRYAEPVNNGADRNPKPEDNRDNKAAEKKNIIIIAVLAIILIAIIASIIAVANGKKENGGADNSELTKISDEMSSDRLSTDRATEDTTEETTEKTTKTTTTVSTWYINTSSSGGGDTDGAGEYKNGEKVVLIATPDEGYTFDGWYSNGIKVSNKKRYSFTANQNASFSAVFVPVTTQSPTPAEPDTSAGDVVFGV